MGRRGALEKKRTGTKKSRWILGGRQSPKKIMGAIKKMGETEAIMGEITWWTDEDENSSKGGFEKKKETF